VTIEVIFNTDQQASWARLAVRERTDGCAWMICWGNPRGFAQDWGKTGLC